MVSYHQCKALALVSLGSDWRA